MSQYNMATSSKQYKLNIINKNNQKLKISIIVGGSLTISHLKRKIQTQFTQLYNIQIVIKVIEDNHGFTISNNSTVQQHFHSGDTIYFTQHGQSQKRGYSMNMASNLGQILSTVRFMTASALEKLDKIDLSQANIMQLLPDLLHLGFWYQNTLIVQKLFHIYNKLFGESSIQKFMLQSTQLQLQLLFQTFTFWLTQLSTPNPNSPYNEITWQLIQLLQKFAYNEKFTKIIKTHKIFKIITDISKDQLLSPQIKKMSQTILKTITGIKTIYTNKTNYPSSKLSTQNFNGHQTQEILDILTKGSPDQKLSTLQQLAQTNFDAVAQGTVRFDYYQQLINIFSIRSIKSKKHILYFNQALNLLCTNSTKDQCIQIMQTDILKKIHSFMLQSPLQTHLVCLQYLQKLSKLSANASMFNIQKSIQLLKTPYPQFLKILIMATTLMSQKLPNISSSRFIPGIKDYITICLKSTDDQLTINLLKIISNLSLDQSCRYQLINLKGIEVLIKFLQTTKLQQISRISSKTLLNLAISSRQNKIKVLNLMNTIIQKFYQHAFDQVTNGFIQTILKSKNL